MTWRCPEPKMRCLHQREEVCREDCSSAGASSTTAMTRTRVRLTVDGMVAVHAVRAVWTSLSVVPGIVHADVTMAGIELVMDGEPEPTALRAALDAALAAAEVRIVTCVVERTRMLPIV